MHMLKPWALPAVLLLLTACASLSGLASLQKPGVTLVNLQMAESTWLEQRFAVDLRVSNPNNVELPISGLNYDLALNGNKLATGGSNEDLTIPALGERVIRLTVSTSTLDWIKQLRDYRRLAERGEKLDLNYALTGKLFLRDSIVNSLPFARSGVVELN